MEIVLIAAMANNYVIGNHGEIPWHISEDLKRFKHLTLDHPVIMGRNTYESIFRRLSGSLPRRTNIVISTTLSSPTNILLVRNLDEALALAEERDTTSFVIGGERVYQEAIAVAQRLELTQLYSSFSGDAYFPRFDLCDWREFSRDKRESYDFVTYLRNS